jgi:hypothetical protein
MSRQTRAAAGAGFLLLGTIVFCAAAGAGIGSLIGAPELLAVLGGFIGVGLGFRVVYTRFRDI